MPVTRRSNACSVQPTEQVTSPRVHSPRRVLRSRQGNAGVLVNFGEGSPSFIRSLRRVSDRFTISKCTDRRCKTCPDFTTSRKIKSNITHKIYEVVNLPGENLSCHTQNIIYLLTCKCCNTQYVGETATPLHERMNGHRTGKVGCEHIINHCKTTCNGHQFHYQILEKLPGSGYDQFGVFDNEMAKVRKEHEDVWMKRLRTIYPYGLNEKSCGKTTNSSQVERAVGKLFPPLPRTGVRPIRSRVNRNSRTSAYSCGDFFANLDNLLDSDITNSFYEIRILLNNTKKKVLKEIAYHIMERDVFTFRSNREQWYLYILDIIDSKFMKSPIEVRKKIPKNVCVVNFVNKGLDDIHLSKIFNSPAVVSLLPECLKNDDDIPSVTTKLEPPIRAKILNYKETIASLHVEVDDDVSFIRDLPHCDCQNSSFCDPHHKHIVTGDLRIIENSKLRKLFSKGPNYRENKTINYSKCRESIKASLDSCVLSLAAKYNINSSNLDGWKNRILSDVNSRITYLKSFKVPQQAKSVLQDEEVKVYLAELHKRFVIVPIDKASNNVAFICKRFYINRLLDEVGVPGDISSTYKLSTNNSDSIIETNIDLCKKYDLEVTDKDKSLPFMYWMPKMHYTPSRARFIVASSSCSTKPLSRRISIIFKHIFNQIENFHRKCTFYKNYNRFWVVQNSSQIIEKLDRLNLRNIAKDISTFDFSTLYTNLEHDDLISVLHQTIDFAFNGGYFKKNGNKKFLTVKGRSCFWSDKSRGKNSFTRLQIKSLVSHLITQTYFEIGNLLFRQCIGIPMGIDPAPFWANLYLHHYEHKYITQLMKVDKTRARKFRNACRFIDDECNLNDGGEFSRSFPNIYPSDLHLKCEHQGTHATFLDLEINIVEGVFVYKLFDKRDGFPFSIVRMPDLSGNIPAHVFYGTIMSEFLRIARATLRYDDFRPRAVAIVRRMLNQGGSKDHTLRQISKAVNRHPIPFQKFSMPAREIVKDITQNCLV